MKFLIPIILTCFSLSSYGQSESSAQRTVDTLIVENSGNGPCSSGTFPTTWRVRFTIALDGSTRPTIGYINGAGEVGTDTSNISKYGPYYWKNNGWDGSVKTVNGTHYPNLLGIEQPAVNQRPWHLDALLTILFSVYPQLYLPGSFHMMGLSEGSSCIQDYIAYQSSPGVFPGAARISSMVDLEGQGGETDFGCTATPAYPAFMGYWAKHYGGHFFGLEGINDSRNIWQITQNIGDSVTTPGYFSYTNFNCGDGSGTGGHGCWNSMYNPAVTNWTNVGTAGNANVVISTSPASTAGNYVYVASTGSNIFQWALRQGDTSLKGVVNPYDSFPAASNTRRIGEYMTGIIDSNGKAALSTNNPNLNGANGSSGGPRGTRIYCIMPTTTMRFRDAAPTLHGMLWLTTIGQVVATGLNDQGQNMVPGFGTQATGTLVTVDSSGAPFVNIYLIRGYYAANLAQGSYAVKHGTASDTLYTSGDLRFGMPGDGILHPDSSSYPVKSWSPAGKRIVQIVASKYAIARLNDGTLWSCGGSSSFNSPPNYAYLCYAGSGTNYLSWHQIPIPGSDSIVWVTGGDVCGSIAIGKSGNWYACGPNSKYLGDATGAGYTTFTNVNTTLRSFVGTLKDSQLVSNSASFFCINTSGQLFGWGLNNMGTVGNGQRANIDSAKYFMDPSATTGLFVIQPTQISTATDWKEVDADNKFGYLAWAKRSGTGYGYYWGRDKVALTERGVDECDTIAGNQGAQYPDSWSLLKPTPTNIRLALATILTPSPYCNTNPDSLYCSLCTRPTTTPTANAGTNQTISTSSAMLSGFGSTCTGGTIISYSWAFASGPGPTPVINDPTSPIPITAGMTTPGAYTYTLTVSDNAGRTSTGSTIVTASGGSGGPPYDSLKRKKFARKFYL